MLNVNFSKMGHRRFTITMLDHFLMTSTNRWIRQRGFIEYPPRSQELTPLDIFTGYLKDMKPATVDELRAAIERKCSQIPRGLFRDVRDSIR